MSLPATQLDAFSKVAQLRHFSRAAKSLGITQSALSQRVRLLEEALGTVLFVREPGNIRLTEAGQKLLRYCQAKEALEKEAVGELQNRGPATEFTGTVRMGGFSSVMRSLVLPALSPLLRKHPKIQLELSSRELHELYGALQRSEVDYIVVNTRLEKEGIECLLLGNEQNVLVESKHCKSPNIYLDHDENDETTFRYLKRQGIPTQGIRRHYLDDVYGILDGVRLGLGKAVLPLHLVKNHRELRILAGKKPVREPFYLLYYTSPFYTKLHHAVLKQLKKISN